MKKGIHPEYKMTKITCVCGNVIETRSTVENINVEICSACHPFYTGKQKLVDTAGRIDRFNKRYGIKESKQFFDELQKSTLPGARITHKKVTLDRYVLVTPTKGYFSVFLVSNILD